MGNPSQKRLIRKLDLELFLSKVKSHPAPNVHLEQYTLSEPVAANLLYMAAYTYGDIIGKKILDLGCGTGRIGLGAAFLGANEAVGVDIDKTAVKVARENSVTTGLKEKLQLICGDITVVVGKFDTVVENPPFGVQNRRADRKFLEKALEVSNAVYSVHNHPVVDRHLIAKLKSGGGQMISVEPSPFILNFVEDRGGVVEAVYASLLTIPKMFSFHTRLRHDVVVDLYVIRRCH
jgi:putative methylase